MSEKTKQQLLELHRKRQELQDDIEDHNLVVLGKLAEMRALDYQIRVLEEKRSAPAVEEEPISLFGVNLINPAG